MGDGNWVLDRVWSLARFLFMNIWYEGMHYIQVASETLFLHYKDAPVGIASANGSTRQATLNITYIHT